MIAHRFRVAEALPGTAELARHAVVDDRDPARALEVVTPLAHARLRPGAREAFQAPAVPAPRGAEVVATVDHEGFPVTVRGRLSMAATPELLRALSPGERGQLCAWLGDDAAREVDELWFDLDGRPRVVPTGTVRGQRVRPPPRLAEVLGPPGEAAPHLALSLAFPAIVPGSAVVASRGAPASGPAAPPAPAWVVTVTLPTGGPLLEAAAIYTGVALADLDRAARASRPWCWAAGTDPLAATRARNLATRLGLGAELVSTGAPPPSFWPATLAALGAQYPVLVGTGIPAVDYALAAGLALTATASVVRHARRVGPARRAARALGALDLHHRATPREAGPEATLFALSTALAAPSIPEVVRIDVGRALDEAWYSLLSRLAPDPRPREEQARQAQVRVLLAAAGDLERALYDDAPDLARRTTSLAAAARDLAAPRDR